jgi:hypothetical protein
MVNEVLCFIITSVNSSNTHSHTRTSLKLSVNKPVTTTSPYRDELNIFVGFKIYTTAVKEEMGRSSTPVYWGNIDSLLSSGDNSDVTHFCGYLALK